MAATLLFTTVPTASHFKYKFIHAPANHRFLLPALFNLTTNGTSRISLSYLIPFCTPGCAVMCFQNITKCMCIAECGEVALNHFPLLSTPCTLLSNCSSMMQGNVVKTLQCYFKIIFLQHQKLPSFEVSLLRVPTLLSKVHKFMFNLVLSSTPFLRSL